MAGNQEIGRIQEWIAGLYGTSVENCPFNREDVRNICRGPMREVLLDFLVPRFRTDAQIYVIRSNLFLADAFKQDSSGAAATSSCETTHEEEVKELRRKIEEKLDEKVDVVKQTVKSAEMIHESEMHVAKDIAENLEYYEKLEARKQLLQHRLLSTTALLEDVYNAKPIRQGTSDGGSSNSNNTLSKAEELSLQMTQLKTLYNKASELFNLYFLTNSNNPELSAEMQELSTAVSALTEELTQAGLKPDVLEKWARKELEISMHELNKVQDKFSNVMNPVEELAKEAEALYIKLMQVHVSLYFKNEQLKKSLQEVTAQKNVKMRDVILGSESVIPADFLSIIQKEEYQRKLLKCRELTKHFRTLEHPDGHDDDKLAVLCELNCDADKNPIEHRASFNEEYTSSSSSDNRFHALKQETLEELTCALLKSFPEGRRKLESTVSQSKLLMEKFANISIGEQSIYKSSKMQADECEREGNVFNLFDLQFKAPQELLKQNLGLANSESFATCEKIQMDMLKEVFEAQNELKESRSQCEALFRHKLESHH